MKVTIPNIKVTGISSGIPKNNLDLMSLGEIYGIAEVKRIISTTGIRNVRVASPEITTSDLCEHAARELFNKLQVKPNSIDGIVFVSQTPDYIMPATSVVLQHKLGLPTSVVAFDINYGCSGYIYGLYQAALLIHSGSCQRVLVCVGDVNTRLINKMDRSVRMVFGDGASATLIEKGESEISFNINTDGSGSHHLIVPAGGGRKPRTTETKKDLTLEGGNIRSEEDLYMNGLEVMNFVIREVPKSIDELLNYVGWGKLDVGTFALHQANEFIVNYLRKKMKLSNDSVPLGVANIGNTGGASIPILLSLNYNQLKEENRLDKVVLAGFGVGLSWAIAATDLSDTVILEPIEI